jgi:CheY-like chemotaxis protein
MKLIALKESPGYILDQKGYNVSVKILLVDDDPRNLELIKIELEDEPNYVVTTAATGERGFQLFRQDSFDFVILDFRLPGIDGAELYKKMRRLRPKIPIVIFSGYQNKYPGIPENDCILKSSTHGSEELKKIIRTHISGGP